MKTSKNETKQPRYALCYNDRAKHYVQVAPGLVLDASDEYTLTVLETKTERDAEIDRVFSGDDRERVREQIDERETTRRSGDSLSR